MTSNQSNAAAVRAFRVLETLAEANRPLSMTELVDALGLPKQTVHRILVQLMDAWLVTRGASDKLYECSARVRTLAINVLMAFNVRSVAPLCVRTTSAARCPRDDGPERSA